YNALQKRAFLSPRNILVDDFNNRILNDLPGITHTYFTQLTHPGIPNHELNLKSGAICSIMRNISIEKGLVKNSRVMITKLGRRLIEVTLLNNNQPNHTLETCLLPRINFYFQPDHCSWTVYRKQFPLRLAYSTTFNSSQGLTLDRIIIDLRTHVFAHGQLYTAISRVKNKDDCLILLPESNTTAKTVNIVYKELIQ
ncbi:11804_t:CDS:2, partial [Racocetra persica]